jgi:DNA-directed RNA polymerase subunit M/transcription elongation factor TFIIS
MVYWVVGVAVMVLEVMSSDPKSGKSTVSCERCGAATSFATLVQPLGDEPGARLYHCPACKHMTWVQWWGWHGRPAGGDATAKG